MRSIDVRIGEPKGKFVKELNIMYCPELLGESACEVDSATWETIGTISLAKGAISGRCELEGGGVPIGGLR